MQRLMLGCGVCLGMWVGSGVARADVVHLEDGGRIRGTILEETADEGVRVQMFDGKTKLIPPEDVKRVEYDESTTAPTHVVEEEEEEPRPRKSKRRRYAEDDRDEEPKRPPPEEEVSKISNMVATGGVLTGIGFAGTAAGLCVILAGLSRNESNDLIPAGGVTVGVGTTMGIVGAALLGVALRDRRDMERKYDMTRIGATVGPGYIGLDVSF